MGNEQYKTDYATKPESLLDDYALQIGLYQKAAELLPVLDPP